jgi:hypothetical protein
MLKGPAIKELALRKALVCGGLLVMSTQFAIFRNAKAEVKAVAVTVLSAIKVLIRIKLAVLDGQCMVLHDSTVVLQSRPYSLCPTELPCSVESLAISAHPASSFAALSFPVVLADAWERDRIIGVSKGHFDRLSLSASAASGLAYHALSHLVALVRHLLAVIDRNRQILPDTFPVLKGPTRKKLVLRKALVRGKLLIMSIQPGT